MRMLDVNDLHIYYGAIKAVNETLSDYMQIQTFSVRDTEFPKTSTLKIKRNYNT